MAFFIRTNPQVELHFTEYLLKEIHQVKHFFIDILCLTQKRDDKEHLRELTL